MLVRQRKTSQKYFDLLAFNYRLNHSNMWSPLDAMNFQKWELFSGSSSRKLHAASLGIIFLETAYSFLMKLILYGCMEVETIYFLNTFNGSGWAKRKFRWSRKILVPKVLNSVSADTRTSDVFLWFKGAGSRNLNKPVISIINIVALTWPLCCVQILVDLVNLQ